ncbi:SPOR domain-containing protein [Pseudoalteromonas sp. T1lg65]|uniref:SPOR domain-containing protein n=1 Tax=Pseudoalteromonas sp. T1lg65 TaxID=2077101 RepID=UPI003F79D0A6
MKRVSRIALALLAVALTGCQSTANKEALDPLEVKKQLALLSLQVTELQKEVEKFREIKQQVERFEEVQQDLDIIATQLAETIISTQVAANDTAPEVEEKEEIIAETAAEPQSTTAGFAIQLASTPDYAKVRQTYEQIKQKLPTEFKQSEVNIEQVNIKNTDYYRLKLGAFADKKAAFKSCQQLKSIGLNCLVSHYTNQRL